jgi:hypothetical protein
LPSPIFWNFPPEIRGSGNTAPNHRRLISDPDRRRVFTVRAGVQPPPSPANGCHASRAPFLPILGRNYLITGVARGDLRKMIQTRAAPRASKRPEPSFLENTSRNSVKPLPDSFVKIPVFGIFLCCHHRFSCRTGAYDLRTKSNLTHRARPESTLVSLYTATISTFFLSKHVFHPKLPPFLYGQML